MEIFRSHSTVAWYEFLKICSKNDAQNFNSKVQIELFNL